MTIRFTKDHEYIRVEGDMAVVGITNFAQEQLGDIVFVELPAVGKALKQGEAAAVVESVKAASDIYCPVSGTVTEVNTALTGEPGLVNADSEGAGWMFKLTLSMPAELDGLLDEVAYSEIAK
jgi:glycine cleavage system H protein